MILREEISDPFEEEEEDAIVVDMTDHADIEGKALRVELRRTRDPITAIKRAPIALRIADEHSLTGLLSPEELPQEGKNFILPYHRCNKLSVFGVLNSEEPITNLIENDNCFYFETSVGQWRLKVLDVGN